MTRRDPFKDKVVWITGASSGIGRALALAFSTTGARLILSGRSEQTLAQVRSDCGTADVRLVPFDLADLDTIPARAAQGLACFGGVDIMVHNAFGGQFAAVAVALSSPPHQAGR